MFSKSPRDRLPFEPRQNKKKSTQQTPSASNATQTKSGTIPEVVNKRMIRRMVIFCGIPTVLAMATFVISYWIVRLEWFKLPTISVVSVSLGLFGLGVLGLSYGILSTSWDEDRVGGWWGWEEFKLNFERMRTAKKDEG